jgi:D-alanyl-D-alanine carboxypeptidase/D-alanyl-D-alanine-endopeptidase (penicillin-binding protein 4)
MDSKEILFEFNRNKNLLPASNLKLITTAAALKILGPDFRFRTEFRIDGHIDRKLNLLRGNLYISGTGDPTTGGNYLKNSSTPELLPLADSLRLSKGIDYIEGRVIAYTPYRVEEAFGRGWDIDDLPSYYSAPVSPLTFHENLTKIITQNGKTEIIPYYPFRIKRDTIPDLPKARFNRILSSDSLVIKSGFKKSATGFITVNDPHKFYELSIAEFLRRNKVSVMNKTIVPEDTAKYDLFTLYSDSLYKIINKCTGESNNLYAEQFFREVAEVFANDTSLTDSLEHIELNYDNLLKINSDLYKRIFGIDNFTLSDGSGLSRMNFFSAEKFVKVLSTMLDDENFIIYLSSFPRPGTNGTLETKMVHPDLQNRLFAKTGSMTGVNALSGYLYTKKNRRIAFSIINNYYDLSRTKTNSVFEDMLIYFVNNF